MYEWVKHFLDEETGFPVKELGGRTRWFVIKGGELTTSWDREELKKATGKNPQSYTYVPATLTDNKVLMEMDPEYFDVLDSLPEEKRDQLLLGCWKDTEASGMHFQRDWIKKATHVPVDANYARGWDTAAGVPDASKGYDPDYTVGVKMAKCRQGFYYICGMKRFREMSGARDNLILSTAQRDGVDCSVVMAQDAGASGKFQYEEFAKKAVENGVICKPDPMPTNKSKLTRYGPFSTACQNGLVFIVESSFEPEELEQFYSENESFNGERSTRTRRDDIPDASASTFNYLAESRVVKIVPRNQSSRDTLAKDLLSKR